MRLQLFLILLAFLNQIPAGTAQVRVAKNISYAGNPDKRQTLNVYYKNNGDQNRDVIVFIHGGAWSRGSKDTYWWLGRNLARKNVVTATINYPLAPNATYKEMALASAKAVKWVQDSIANYGGNPKRIFLMGHSAGAHLSELINADNQYFKEVGITNPIKGMILNDVFGLDMDEYLTKSADDNNYKDFLRTFSTENQNWQLGSPLTYVKNIKNPHLIFYGSKTYPAIQIQSERLNRLLKEQNVPVTLDVIKGKKHVGMITQMIFGCNDLYKHILQFITDTK